MVRLDLDGLYEHWSRNKRSYLLICLLGKIKSESVESRIYQWRIRNIYLLNPPIINDLDSLGGGFYNDYYIRI